MENPEVDGERIDILGGLPNPMADLPGAMDGMGAGVDNLITRVRGAFWELTEWWAKIMGQ